MNNLKTKVGDLDVGKLKTVPLDLKKLSDVVDNEFLKNTKLNTLKIKVNNLESKIPDTTTLPQISQTNTGQQNLEKNIGDVDKKLPDTSRLVTTTVLNTKISEIENTIPDTSNLGTAHVSGSRLGIKFDKNPLAIEKYNYLTKIVNVYIIYDLVAWQRNPTNNFKFKNCLFGATNIVKNSDKEKYVYNGYGITFDSGVSWRYNDDFA